MAAANPGTMSESRTDSDGSSVSRGKNAQSEQGISGWYISALKISEGGKMHSYQIIVDLIKLRQRGITYRECARTLSIGHSTVSLIMRRYRELGKTLEDLEAMEPKAVEDLFYPREVQRRKEVPLPDFEPMCRQLEEEGSRLNITALWTEYATDNPDPYGYTQFAKYFRQYVEETRGPQGLKMLIERVPGENMYIDWVGDQPEILLDPLTGELCKVHIFCATLGVSSLGYVEVFADEKLPSFLLGITHALEYYGALPRFIVPDNLKTAVTANTKNDLVLTAACRDLQDYYNVVFMPPPPAKPTGKGTVENYVGFIERRFIEPLKAQAAVHPFTSIGAINEKGSIIRDDLNSRLERGRKKSRREIFQTVDLPHMRPLPEKSFTIWDYARFDKVPKTYHLYYDNHRYSVPWQCADKPAVLRASTSEVVITDENNRLLAKHRRIYNEYPKNVTDPAHLHPEHAFYASVNEYDGSKYRDWAQNAGPKTVEVMARLLATTDHEEQMYPKVAGVVCDAKDATAEEIEKAADECLKAGTCTCTGFRSAITANLNRRKNKPTQIAGAVHPNVRGKEYYR